MAEKLKTITTPFLKVVWAYTSKPDRPIEEGKAPQYKVNLAIDKAELDKFVAEIKDKLSDYKFTSKKLKWGYSERETGFELSPHSNFKPTIFDMKNQKIQTPVFDKETEEYTNWKDDVKLGAGSVVRAYCELFPYKKGVNEGVSLRLLSLQVKELVEWERRGGSSPFGASEEPDEDTPFGTEDNGASALDI